MTEAGIRATLDFMAKVSPRSLLAFSYSCKEFVEESALYGHRYHYKRMFLRDKSWLFGMDPEDMDVATSKMT